METFMDPGSVAVIGASRKTGDGSFNLIENMLEFGFRGSIFPVNPSASEIAGKRAFKRIQDIRDNVDLAIISTPREEIPRLVEDCAGLGIGAAIIVPQGFADADRKGIELQKDLGRIARERGIRVLGPNTLGVVNAFSGFSSSFMPLKRQRVPVGVVCQSGIFFVGSSAFTGPMGKGIDIGNACDLDLPDALDYFGSDDKTELVFAHIEGLNQGRNFLETALAVSRKKPIIALKTARTEQGARAAASHSGSMVGSHNLFEAAFRQGGVIGASDPEDIPDLTRAFLRLPLMKGNRVAIITFTGAGGIILIDSLCEQGLELARLSGSTLDRIRDLSPPWMPINNPVDIWPALMKQGMSKDVYKRALKDVLGDPGVDGLICIAIAPHIPDQSYLDVTGLIGEAAADFPEKPVVAWLYGPNQEEVSEALELRSNALVVSSLPRAVRVLAALCRRHSFLENLNS